MTKYTDEQAAKAIVAVLPDSRWVGAGLAQAYLWAVDGRKETDYIARRLYDLNCYSLNNAHAQCPQRGRCGYNNVTRQTNSCDVLGEE